MYIQSFLFFETGLYYCDGLNNNGLQRLMFEYIITREWHYLRRIGRIDLVGVGVALWDKIFGGGVFAGFRKLTLGLAGFSLPVGSIV